MKSVDWKSWAAPYAKSIERASRSRAFRICTWQTFALNKCPPSVLCECKPEAQLLGWSKAPRLPPHCAKSTQHADKFTKTMRRLHQKVIFPLGRVRQQRKITNDEKRLLLNFSGESRITLSSWIFMCSFFFLGKRRDEKISAASSTFSHESGNCPTPKNRFGRLRCEEREWVYFLSPGGGWNRVQMDCIFDLSSSRPRKCTKSIIRRRKLSELTSFGQ